MIGNWDGNGFIKHCMNRRVNRHRMRQPQSWHGNLGLIIGDKRLNSGKPKKELSQASCP